MKQRERLGATVDWFTNTSMVIGLSGLSRKMWVRIRLLAMGYFTNQREGRPVNITNFGGQTVRTRVYHVLPQETPRLDVAALLEEARTQTGRTGQIREEAWVL